MYVKQAQSQILEYNCKRDSSAAKSSASHAGEPGYTNAWMRMEDITSCKNHVAPVSWLVHNDLF